MAQTPKNRKYFEDLVSLSKDNGTFNERTMQALTWHRNKVRNVFGIKDTPPDTFFSKNNYPNVPLPGNIVTFRYDPQTKAKLPFYDIFPLVLVLRLVPGGFIGLNFHHLHPIDRATFMSKLTKFERASADGTIKINIRYSNLKSLGSMPFHEQCVRMYKKPRIRTLFYTLTPEEWDIALFLPTERYVKRNKADVWKESRNSVRRNR